MIGTFHIFCGHMYVFVIFPIQFFIPFDKRALQAFAHQSVPPVSLFFWGRRIYFDFFGFYKLPFFIHFSAAAPIAYDLSSSAFLGYFFLSPTFISLRIHQAKYIRLFCFIGAFLLASTQLLYSTLVLSYLIYMLNHAVTNLIIRWTHSVKY